MFDWVLNIPLIFEFFRGNPSSLFYAKKKTSQLTHSSRASCWLCNFYKSLLIVSSFVHFYLQLVFSSISTLSLKLYLLKDEACPLIKERRSKRMDIQRQTLAKSSIIQFHHLLTNKQWLVHFKILYISSTFTNITMLFMKSISLESAIINFVLL